MNSDYRAIPELDQYDRAGLAEDNEEEGDLDYKTRREAEEEMDQRDRGYGRRGWRNAMEEEGLRRMTCVDGNRGRNGGGEPDGRGGSTGPFGAGG